MHVLQLNHPWLVSILCSSLLLARVDQFTVFPCARDYISVLFACFTTKSPLASFCICAWTSLYCLLGFINLLIYMEECFREGIGGIGKGAPIKSLRDVFVLKMSEIVIIGLPL